MSEKACRAALKDRSEGLCERCGRGFYGGWGLTIHHRLKRSQGGLWTVTNCVAVCGHGTAGCHGWIEHHPDEAEVDGWHVRPHLDPAEVAIKKWDATWVWLTEDGGYLFA